MRALRAAGRGLLWFVVVPGPVVFLVGAVVLLVMAR